MENHLQQERRMEAIANLAGGIAHQFNNALTGITGSIDLLKLNLPAHEKTEKHFGIMKDSVRKMVLLTNQLLAYAQGGRYIPTTVSLSEFVEDRIPLIKREISSAVRLETDLRRDTAHVNIDLTQMQMLLSAVILNAAEAINEAGCIRILTRNEKIDSDLLRDRLGLEPGPYVCLAVEDDGVGMDEETKRRLFEPFYSTKFQGRGLSMAAVYGIVKHHLGSISVDSNPGRGTVVRIYLPATNGHSRPSGPV